MPPKQDRPLNQHDVNLRILDKEEVVHSDYDILNVSGRFREEDYDIYAKKRRQFYDSVRQYKDLNMLALKTNKFKSDIEGDIQLNCEFLEKTDECLNESYEPETLIRKRTMRPIQGEYESQVEILRSPEPWFRRYLVLNRFIQVARKLIVKTRMLKRLGVLKSLTPEVVEHLDQQGFYVYNKSYKQIFAKFLK